MIQKLRDDFGIMINVPSPKTPTEDEKADQIKLIGYEDRCLKAKAAIDEMIRELVRSKLICFLITSILTANHSNLNIYLEISLQFEICFFFGKNIYCAVC